MTDDEIMHTLRTLPERRGPARFAALLGFAGRIARATLPRTHGIRHAATARRGALRLHTIRLRSRITAGTLRTFIDTAHTREPAAHHVILALEPRATRVALACDPLGNGLRHTILEPAALRAVDIEITRDVITAARRDDSAAAVGIMRALDRRALTDRFFRDVRAVRNLVAAAWTHAPPRAADRDTLALLLLSRLMFLYFLQRRGLLAREPHYLHARFLAWQRRPQHGTFYRTIIRTLFFGVLNRRPERRTRRAHALGPLPYLNGGLFEPHALERLHPRLDLPDPAFAQIFSLLLERYRFTTTDPAADTDDHAGIDPELLGRIFEGLMPSATRSRTGTFYTPTDAVQRLVDETLAQHLAPAAGLEPDDVARLLTGAPSDCRDHELLALSRSASAIRILDPSCGSGAFLLGALGRLSRLRALASPDSADSTALRRDIVAASLHGVDLLADAALICSLRLWLALVPDCDDIHDVPPLPNLDRRIRQGDALVDPLDTHTISRTSAGSRALRAILSRLTAAGRDYLDSAPGQRASLRRQIRRLEAGLAREWLRILTRRVRADIADTTARAADRDLFGESTQSSRAASALLPALHARIDEIGRMTTALDNDGALPFFSFPIHFPASADGFDIILGNPPWVRAHAWPDSTGPLLRQRYRVCRDAGWPFASSLTNTPPGAAAQVDLAFLFLERAIALLREGGTLGMVLPAKLLRSLAPGGARSLLLSDTRVTTIEDHSLEQRAIFQADAFTTMITARRAPACPHHVHVRMSRAGMPDLTFTTDRADLPLRPDDPRSPWLLAPPDCRTAIRTLLTHPHAATRLTVRRGAMTSANARMIVTRATPRLSDLVEITTAAGTPGIVERSTLRPIIRGTDIRAWHASPSAHVLWSPANDDPRATPPRRFAAFARRALEAGHDATLQRLNPALFRPRVVWSDLAPDLRCAAVPARVRSLGTCMDLIPLNTVYYIPTDHLDDALLLTAYLNSLPLRTCARAIAERAKDAHFRFFAWTIGMLPLPDDWRTHATASRLLEIATTAHADGGLSADTTAELDSLVADTFRLPRTAMHALRDFDAWLAGRLDDTASPTTRRAT